MKYKCKLVSIKQLLISSQGFVTSLCDKCGTRDCSNPIEKRKVSILGVTRETKVFVGGHDEQFVIECMGFSKDEK